MEPILTKRQFFHTWNEGELGNKPRTWKTFHEALKSGFSGLMAIRYVGHGWGGPFIPNIRRQELSLEMNKLIQNGWYPGDFHISEQLTPGIVDYVINGEVIRNENGLSLYFSTKNDLMRPALIAGGQNVFGLTAEFTLKKFLWPADFEELSELVDHYHNHAVEFSGFDQYVGVIPKRHMIIWEVRQY